MDELLANPAVQGAAAPFIVALAVAALLMRSRFAGLAVCAAIAVVAALSMGFSLESLTASRKLVLVVLATGAVILLAGLDAPAGRPAARTAVAVAAGLATVWVLLRVLQQAEAPRGWLTGGAAALFVALLAFENQRDGEDPVRTAAASLWLGLGAGVLALLGGSAVLALVGIAVGAGAGAVLLIQMITGRPLPANWALGLPAAVAAGLVAVVSVFTGQLPWYAPLPLLAVPFAARLLPAGARPAWLHAFLSASAALVPALLAVALAWFGAAPPP
jgi:hypothetical protein